MTTIIYRLVCLSLILQANAAFAFQYTPLFSTDLLSSFGLHSDARPLTWGYFYQGHFPKYENEEKPFSLASVKKVITAATSLRVLGSEFRFANEFSGDYDSINQAIFSPVFAVSGDPTWGSPDYGESLSTRVAAVVRELQKLKVKRVVGEVKVSLLSSAVGNFARPKGWKNSWLLECYASLPTPVVLNGNCAQLVINLEKSFWLTNGVSTPIENRLQPSKMDSVQVVPELDDLGRVKKYTLSGGISKPTSIYLPVHSNEDWLKNLFIQELKANKIEYVPSADAATLRSETTTPFYVDLSSQKLKDMLIPFLQSSINIVGERLHLEASDDLETIASLLSDPNDYQNVTLVDGSGLMAANQVSPKTFYKILSALQHQSYFHDLFAGLPVSGQSGTLKNRMNTTLLKGRIHAKTGTIDHVVNLAGYWSKQNDSLEPFVIFTDSSLIPQAARKLVDDMVDEFARKN